MTIARVSGQVATNSTGGPVDSCNQAFPGNVTTGSLLVFYAYKGVVGTSNAFDSGDVTKASGTATIGAISLDRTQNFVGVNSIHVGIYSCLVTGGGSLTMTLGGMTSEYPVFTVREYSGSWDASRVEASNGANGSGSSTADSGNASSAGAGLFAGAMTNSAVSTVSITPGNSFSEVYENEVSPGVAPPGAFADRIVSSGTTTSATWSLGSGLDSSACVVVYKETAGGGGTSYTIGAAVGTFTLGGQSSSLLRVQLQAPTSDVSNAGTWTQSTGGTLYGVIDEANADDADYIYSPGNPTAAMCEVALTAGIDPLSSGNHKVRYRASCLNADSVLIVRLMQGSSTIAAWTSTLTAGAAVTGFEQTLSGGQADAITNYANLRLQFSAS